VRHNLNRLKKPETRSKTKVMQLQFFLEKLAFYQRRGQKANLQKQRIRD
jgi:hypothetical protein